MNLVWELNEAAKVEVKPEVRKALKECATALATYIDDFWNYREEADLVDVNGAWAWGKRVLATATPLVDPTPPTSGAMDVEDVERLAA